MDAAPKLAAYGYRTAIIGNGSIEALGKFAKKHSGFVDLYTDPSLETYKTLGMMHGLGGMASFKMLPNAFRAIAKGFRQSKTQGDPLQQGGVCVINRESQVVFAHQDQTAGDHLNADELMAQLEPLQKASG